MKNLLIVLAIAGLTSCSKDSFQFEDTGYYNPEKSEIAVSVSYLTWDEDCLDGCTDNGQRVVFMENASLTLLRSEVAGGEAEQSFEALDETDYNGFALFEDIEPGKYTLKVKTALGEKSRIITTQLHKRSFVDFSF